MVISRFAGRARRRRPAVPTAAAFSLVLLVLIWPAGAQPAFTGATGGISFGVAPLGAPVSPGAPTYLLNNFNGRQDILTNPGVGLTASPVVANNTSSVGPVAWGPGQFIFNTQVGGGNVNGAFGSGSAFINGPQFGYALSDGGVPGGVSSSYEILSWDATFNQGAGSPLGTLGTYITMGGTVPLVQDLAMVSLRTQLIGNTIGAVEVPGLILAVERTGALTYNALALQDNLVPGVTAMPGGWAILIDAPTGNFRALAYNAFPDLGALDGFAIPAGEVFAARVTATVYSDPSFLSMFNPLDEPDLLAAAVASNNVPFPSQFLFQTPEPTVASTIVLGLAGLLLQRRRDVE